MIEDIVKYQELRGETWKSRLVGLVTVALFFGVFGIWSVTAPLEGAVIAGGSVMVQNNRKVIQHLEGGIIEEIKVKDGDSVEAGDLLVVLDNKNILSKRDSVLWNLREKLATRARLVAEKGYMDELVFDHELLKADSKELHDILEREQNLFKIRKESHEEQVEILNKRVSQLENQISGLRSQYKSTQDQIKLIEEEMRTVQSLLERGLEQRPRLLGLQRKAAELKGSLGEYQSLIAKAEDTISENRYNILNLNTERLNEASKQLKEVEPQIVELKENWFSLSDAIQRSEIRAPQAGIITGLKYHTPKGVIAPGAPIMEIVPQDQKLLIEVKLAVNDIESVGPDQSAKIMLSAYRSREVPRIDGKVTYISADRFQDEVTGKFYYTVHIEPLPGAMEKLTKDIKLYPGMPAEVFIVTDKRTFMQYLLAPFKESVQKAFKE